MSRDHDDDFDDDVHDDGPKLSFFQRLRYTMVKPDDDGNRAEDPNEPKTVEEIEAAIARANDKERAIGLIAAPVGAAIGLLVANNLIDHAKLTGQPYGTFQTLSYVLLGMAVLVLATSWLRKRLFMGMLLALFGLGIFNLHYWGFGIPFILAGAWLLVRQYRLTQKLKVATGAGPGQRPRKSATRPEGVLPRPNKRYTPRMAPRRRPSKPGKEQQAG